MIAIITRIIMAITGTHGNPSSGSSTASKKKTNPLFFLLPSPYLLHIQQEG